MTAEEMHLIILQQPGHIGSTLKITGIIIFVPSGSMHVDEYSSTFRYITQILFKPCQLGIGYRFQIFLVTHIVDVFHRNHVNLSDIKRIIGRTEIPVIIMLGINRCTDSHIMQILISFIKIVISDSLEHGEAQRLAGFHIFLVKRHIVEY